MTAKVIEAKIKCHDSRIAELEGEVALLDRNVTLFNYRIERADNLVGAIISLNQLVADAGDVRQCRQWLDLIEAVGCQMSQILEGTADKENGGGDVLEGPEGGAA